MTTNIAPIGAPTVRPAHGGPEVIHAAEFQTGQRPVAGLLDVLIKAGLVAGLVIFAFQVFQPFLELMLWAVILAVTLYPLQQRIKRASGLKDGHAATLVVLLVLLVLPVPIYLVVVSLGESVESLVTLLKSGA